MWPFTKRTKTAAPVNMGAIIRASQALPQHAQLLREINATNRRVLRMYDAAISTNLNADFPVTITSSNAELLTSLSALRSHARRLERDNPYAWAILESMRASAGGHEPFRLEMKVGKKTADGEFVEENDTNEKIQDWWRDAGRPENCTVRRDTSRLELDLQAVSAVVRDGGILYRHHAGFPNNKFGYAIEPIEVDRLDHYWNRPAVGTNNEIQFSIEFDEYHAPIAYWILSRHPGDTYAYSSTPRYRTRIPADEIIALFDLRSRAGQYVATSRFASVIQRLHRLDQFDVAHVTAAIWASCKPFFITQEFPTAMEYVPDFIKTAIEKAMDGEGDDEGAKMSNVEPGTGEILPYGQKPVLVDPKFPIEAASEFKKDQLRGAAAGSGTAYHMIGNDLADVNFSSGRLGENQFHDTCKMLQNHLIESFRRPHFERALKYAILSGQLNLPMTRYEEFCKAAIFHGRRWPYINPLQDAQADILRIEAGLDSRDYIIQNSERGGDVEKVNAEIASGRKSDDAHGLDFTSDPTDPTVKKGEPGEEETAPSAGEPEKPKKARKPRKKAHGTNGETNGFHRNGSLSSV